MEFLERFGLSQWANHRPNELSGGQKQRVALARAMIADPKVILADEPTGAVDNATSLEVMNIFIEINTQGITLIVITHEKEIAAMTDRIVYLDDGVIKIGR